MFVVLRIQNFYNFCLLAIVLKSSKILHLNSVRHYKTFIKLRFFVVHNIYVYAELGRQVRCMYGA